MVQTSAGELVADGGRDSDGGRNATLDGKPVYVDTYGNIIDRETHGTAYGNTGGQSLDAAPANPSYGQPAPTSGGEVGPGRTQDGGGNGAMGGAGVAGPSRATPGDDAPQPSGYQPESGPPPPASPAASAQIGQGVIGAYHQALQAAGASYFSASDPRLLQVYQQAGGLNPAQAARVAQQASDFYKQNGRATSDAELGDMITSARAPASSGGWTNNAPIAAPPAPSAGAMGGSGVTGPSRAAVVPQAPAAPPPGGQAGPPMMPTTATGAPAPIPLDLGGKRQTLTPTGGYWTDGSFDATLTDGRAVHVDQYGNIAVKQDSYGAGAGYGQVLGNTGHAPRPMTLRQVYSANGQDYDQAIAGERAARADSPESILAREQQRRQADAAAAQQQFTTAQAKGTPGSSADARQKLLDTLPEPNQISVRQWNRMTTSEKQFYLSAYEKKGYDPNDVVERIDRMAPTFRAPVYGTARV